MSNRLEMRRENIHYSYVCTYMELLRELGTRIEYHPLASRE